MIKSFTSQSSSKSRSRANQRQELDVNLYLILAIALGITLIFYVLLLPFRSTAIGTILYDRGFTQYLDIYFASVVIALTVLKFIKIRKELQIFSKNWLSQRLSLLSTEESNSEALVNLYQSLARESSLVASRCGRVVGAYIQSGDRKTATEFAIDDSSFYTSASEASYAFPRVLIWAIPLLGFIGTVVGISQAVNGFSGVLQKAEEIEQIKAGIGTVTDGLAVAFDTTLLALFVSILVMIPLVLVERYENKLLLAIDIFINDKLLPKLKDKTQSFDRGSISEAVNSALKENFPQPHDLIAPAHDYAERAAQSLAQGFLSEVGKVEELTARVMEQVTQVNQGTLGKVQEVSDRLLNQLATAKEEAIKERQEFLTFLQQQQLASQRIAGEIQNTVDQVKANNTSVSNSILSIATGLTVQTEQISKQLEQAAKLLEARIQSLELSTSKIAEISQHQPGLDHSVNSLEQVNQLKQVLSEMQQSFAQLRPVLEKINKPRRITLIEQDGGDI